MTDHYRTVGMPAEFRQKIERSEFLGLVFPIVDDAIFFAELATQTKKHYDATHLCWAFRLFGNGNLRARSADAGEPSGTAGKPILAAIEGAGLLDVGVIVVRWYGGIKLGTGGLARAYRETAAAALRVSTIEDRFLYQRFRIAVPFDQLGVVYRLIDAPHVILMAERFGGSSNEFDFDVRLSRADAFSKMMVEKRLAILL